MANRKTDPLVAERICREARSGLTRADHYVREAEDQIRSRSEWKNDPDLAKIPDYIYAFYQASLIIDTQLQKLYARLVTKYCGGSHDDPK